MGTEEQNDTLPFAEGRCHACGEPVEPVPT